MTHQQGLRIHLPQALCRLWWRVRVLCYLFTCLAVASVVHADSVKVSREQIAAAMETQTGYDPTVTTNGARFQAATILELVKQAASQDSTGTPLLIAHEDWYHAFLQTQSLPEEQAPQFIRLAFEHRQETLVEYRHDRVIASARGELVPKSVANVVIWWEPRPDEKRKYSYEDTISTPNLKVTNHRVISYRLIDFGDQMMFAEINGVTGRPTTGVLGFLFKLIGEGRVVWSRMAIAEDGLQVARARSKKGFLSVASTVTVQPDGMTSKDLPEGRPDLVAIEDRLKQPIDLEYQPLDLSRY